MSSLLPVDIPQNSMAGQQRQQISELQFNKFPNPQSYATIQELTSQIQDLQERVNA